MFVMLDRKLTISGCLIVPAEPAMTVKETGKQRLVLSFRTTWNVIIRLGARERLIVSEVRLNTVNLTN